MKLSPPTKKDSKHVKTLYEGIELWKDVPGYEGKYQASTFSNIRSLDMILKGRNSTRRHKGKVLKQRRCSTGYLKVSLCSDVISVHRVLALTFIPNPDNKPQVNHKNGVRDDARIDNLEWCTVSENISHSYRELGRKAYPSMTGKKGALNPTSKKVEVINTKTGETFIYDSVTEACKELNVDNGYLGKRCSLSASDFSTYKHYKVRFATHLATPMHEAKKIYKQLVGR